MSLSKKILSAPWPLMQMQTPSLSPAGANKTRGAATKNQLNTVIAACDEKQKEQ
jgi:hypothetical protein